MGIIKRTGVIIFLVTYLFGIMGMSVFHHSCASSGKKKVALYSGIYSTVPGSCCGDGSMDFPGHHPAGLPVSFDEPACCKSTISFFSLKVTTERVEKLQVPADGAFQTQAMVACAWPVKTEGISGEPLRTRYHSPPLAGRLLLLFLHQVKIPALPEIS